MKIAITVVEEGAKISLSAGASINVLDCNGEPETVGGNGFGCVIKGSFLKNLAVVTLKDPKKAAPWLKDQWLMASVTGDIDTMSNLGIFMALGRWNNAFGVDGLAG